MKPTPLFDYFFFGTCVRYLEDIRTGYRIHTTDEGMYVLGNLSAFYSYLNELNLQVTYRASGNLLPLLEELGESDKDARLTEDQAQKLSSAMHEVRCTLEAELKGFEIYVVTPKRIDTVRLLHDISALFAPAVFEKLPEIARYDLMEAGKCIAFERPTAAAFHLMRATEAVLRAFYFQHVQRNRIQQMLWGPVVQDLRGRRKFGGNERYSVLFANLDNIRLSFRNPTQHPDKTYDIQEVQDLWGLCVDVISRMAKDFPGPEDETPT